MVVWVWPLVLVLLLLWPDFLHRGELMNWHLAKKMDLLQYFRNPYG